VRIPFAEAGAFPEGKAGPSFSDRSASATEGSRAASRTDLEVVREAFERDGIDISVTGTMSRLRARDPEHAYPANGGAAHPALRRSGVAIEGEEAYGVPHRQFSRRPRWVPLLGGLIRMGRAATR